MKEKKKKRVFNLRNLYIELPLPVYAVGAALKSKKNFFKSLWSDDVAHLTGDTLRHREVNSLA